MHFLTINLFLVTHFRNGNFLVYFEKLYSRRQSWALSFRNTMLTRGNNTNNFVEAAMRVLKDKILLRTMAFNLPVLFDLLTVKLPLHYSKRLALVGVGRWQETIHRSRFRPLESSLKSSDIHQVNFFVLNVCRAAIFCKSLSHKKDAGVKVVNKT